MGIIYDALTIAKWIINKIHPEPLKLQKLLYLAQGYSYAFYDRPLFKDDLGLSFAQIGFITLVYQLSASVFQPITGIIFDKYPVAW